MLLNGREKARVEAGRTTQQRPSPLLDNLLIHYSFTFLAPLQLSHMAPQEKKNIWSLKWKSYINVKGMKLQSEHVMTIKCIIQLGVYMILQL